MTRTADLSGSEPRLVEYPEFELATATSTQLAGRTGTSRSTSDRLARKFGSGGHTRRTFLALIVAILTMGASKKKAKRVKKYRWVTANGGDIPNGAAPQGHEATGESLYVCRANYEGGLYPGKIRGAFGGANIPYNGKEVKVNPYEVLVGGSE